MVLRQIKHKASYSLPEIQKNSICHDKELKLTAYSQKLEHTMLEA